MGNNQKGIAIILPIILALLIFGLFAFVTYRSIQQGNTESNDRSSNDVSLESNKTQNDPSQLGKYCKFTAEHGEEITYYESGDKYYLSEVNTNPDNNNSKYTFNVLFTGSNYYYWSLGGDQLSVNYKPLVYTKEQAQNLSMVRTYQITEVEKNQQYCKTWQVDTQIFVPPNNIEFTTLGQEAKEWKTAADEGFINLCNICLQEFVTRQEQLDCFSISNIVAQQPKEVVESLFEEYCVAD